MSEGTSVSERLREARAVADAVLYEGYLLYPYRASSDKNRVRWQFGVLGPRVASGPDPAEGSTMATDCLVEGGDDTETGARVRFLQLQSRTVERHRGGDRYSPVDRLECAGRTWLSWDEAVDHEIDLGRVRLADLASPADLTGPAAGGRRGGVHVPGGAEFEYLRDEEGNLLGRVVRRRWPLTASLRLALTHSAPGPRTLRLELVNDCSWPVRDEPSEADRQHPDDRSRALRYSLLSAHVTLQAFDGAFVSVIDPPPEAEAAARACRSERLWPVLIGGEDDHDVVLAAPIILYDRPRIAKGSAGDLFDSTEIDEMLSLRVMTLTDAEKHEARATDPRAAEIVDRCDTMAAADLERMHSSAAERIPPPSPSPEAAAVDRDRVEDEIPVWATPGSVEGVGSDGEKPWWDPGVDASVDPATDAVDVDGVPVARGSHVRLRPGPGADAQDLFFAGQAATVTGVHHDVDGQTHVAVVLRDDPASDLHRWYGRYLYFRPDEIEPLEQLGSPGAPEPEPDLGAEP